jgi:hypothetical protein
MLNRGYAYTTIISSKYHGQTLLSHLASLYPHSTPQAWQQRLNNGEVALNGVTASGSESVTSGQTLVWNRPPWIEPDSPLHFEVCLKIPICWPSTNPAGCPLSPAAASWKTPSCAWCKSKPRTQTLSTGWAEALPASSSSPKQRRRPLNYPRTGTHPEFKKSTGRWRKALHSTTPTKFSHPSDLYRTRASVRCGPPARVANRQSHWRR